MFKKEYTMQKYISMFGYANILGGFLLLAFWYLYAILLPYQKLDTTLSILVTDKNWAFVNILGVSGSIIGLIGLVGIFYKGSDAFGTLGLIGFMLAFIGTVLLTGALLWDTVIWPILVSYDSAILDFQGPIYTSKTFVPFFVISGLVYSLGYIIFGIGLAKSGLFPPWAGIMLSVGAPLFGLGSMFGKLQVYPRTLGITLFSLALIWIGNILRS
jgi:hypothetical protein